MQNLNLFDIEVDAITLNLANLVFSCVVGAEQPIAGENKNPFFYSKLKERIAKFKIVGNYSEKQLKIIVTSIENKATTISYKLSTQASQDLPMDYEGLVPAQYAHKTGYIIPETFSSILADVEGFVMEGKSFEEIESWLDTTTK
jgi:hypothetical protein